MFIGGDYEGHPSHIGKKNVSLNVACELSQPMGKTEFSSITKIEQTLINLLGELYLISINLFLILISKLVPLTLELARTLNMFIRLQVMLLRAI